jgi:predicted RNA-binding Zn ribbon-like protein
MDLGPEPWTFLPGGRPPAPGVLRTVQELVNTTNLESGQDAIDTPAGLATWLVGHRLLSSDEPVRPADVPRAAELREALRQLLMANAGEPLTPAAPAALDLAARAAHLTLRFETAGRAALEPTGGGVDAAFGRVLAIVHGSMVEGTWPRLKACRRDVCHWAFYDHSKNRSGTWCAMEICGNRTKTSSYRRRRLPRPR